MICILNYPMPYSFMLAMFYPCENHFDYNGVMCGSICFLFQPKVGILNWSFNIFGPVLIILFFHLFLFLRIFQKKCEMLRKNTWKRASRMVWQLLSITALLSLSWLPISLSSAINVISLAPTRFEQYFIWLLYFCIYLSALSSPVISIFVLPEIKSEVSRWIQQRRIVVRNQVHPMVTHTNQRRGTY